MSRPVTSSVNAKGRCSVGWRGVNMLKRVKVEKKRCDEEFDVNDEVARW